MVNYAVPDRSNKTPNFVKTPENDALDIGWAEGTFSDGRPYRAESWCQDQVTVLTIFFSTLGLEAATNTELAQLLVREHLLTFTGADRFVSGVRFRDPSGHELWSVNVVIGDDESIFVEDNVPLTPYVRRRDPPLTPPPAEESPV